MIATLFGDVDTSNLPGYPAVFSPGRLHRYVLWRAWETTKPYCAFIGLNPSTADERKNDPTVRRCVQFAKDWGYGSLVMLNLFGFRSTSPYVMKEQLDPAGPDNREWVLRCAKAAGVVVAAWGNHGRFHGAGDQMREFLEVNGVALNALRITKQGQPQHPLYVNGRMLPAKWDVNNSGE